MRKPLLILALIAAVGAVAACGKQLPTQTPSRDSSIALEATRGAELLGPGAAIGDRIWSDLDGNGLQGLTEPGIEGVTVTVAPIGETARLNGGEKQTTKTGKDGFYEFKELLPGDYELIVETPDGCEPTKSLVGKDRTVDSDTSPLQIKLGETPDPTIDFGFLCKKEVDCAKCDGGVTVLTLKYQGKLKRPVVKVESRQPRATVFRARVTPGESFSFEGSSGDGTLGRRILVYVNGHLNARFRTDCDRPIGPGLTRGDFVVVSGQSLEGDGELCPLDPKPPTGPQNAALED